MPLSASYWGSSDALMMKNNTAGMLIADLTARGIFAISWHQKKVGETVVTQTFWILIIIKKESISELLTNDVQKILTCFYAQS